MTITLESDYAIRIVWEMAQSGQRLGSGEISELTGVPPRFTLKIMRKLVGAGIVRSSKGSRGGYTLNKPPREITLRAVIEAIEGEFALSRCQGDHSLCSHPGSGSCRFRPEFERVSAMVRRELDATDFGGVDDHSK